MDPQRARYARFETRRKVNKELSQLLVELNPPSPVSLSQEKLETLCIQCSEMAILPEKERDAGPVFCKLVPPSTINKAFDSTFTNSYTIEWPGYDPRFDSRFYAAYHIGLTLLDYTLSGEEVREPLVRTEWHTTGLELTFVLTNPKMAYHSHRDSSGALTLHRHFYPNTRILWGVIQILQADSAHHPHLACLHMDDAPADEGLRPSELISAVKLMKQALHLDKLNQFRVNPVRKYLLSPLSPTRLVLIQSFCYRSMYIPSPTMRLASWKPITNPVHYSYARHPTLTLRKRMKRTSSCI